MTLMGLLVGILVGLTGVGGAALLTPVLVMIGIQPTIAVATDLFYNSITKLFGSIQHYRQKTIDMQLVKYLAMGSVPSAILAITLLQVIEPLYRYQESIIKHALGFVLIIVALATIAKQIFGRGDTVQQVQPKTHKKGLSIAIGSVLGFLVGLTSVGSGSLFALAMLYFYRLKASELVGTDIAHAFILVSAAGMMHMGLGNVDYALAFRLLLGSVPGVLIGSYFSAKVPPRPLRTLLAAMILLSGVRLI
jgi:hypothetical protein